MAVNGRLSSVARASEALTVRDYFAAAALQGGLEQGVENDHAELVPGANNWWHSSSHIAKRAYAIADAMLAAREGRP